MEEAIMQNCMELQAASKHNPIQGNVFGAITTGDSWRFIKYSPPESGLPSIKNWHISKVFKINIPDKVKDVDEEVEEKIKEVASYVTWIIESEYKNAANYINATKTS